MTTGTKSGRRYAKPSHSGPFRIPNPAQFLTVRRDIPRLRVSYGTTSADTRSFHNPQQSRDLTRRPLSTKFACSSAPTIVLLNLSCNSREHAHHQSLYSVAGVTKGPGKRAKGFKRACYSSHVQSRYLRCGWTVTDIKDTVSEQATACYHKPRWRIVTRLLEHNMLNSGQHKKTMPCPSDQGAV